MLHYPDDIRDIMSTCALRFDGYRYESTSPLCQGYATLGGLSRLFAPVVEALTLYADDNLNFAAFFGLQRYLCKWGGEYLTEYSDEHFAFDFLFLHLYHLDVPDAFRNLEYCAEWQMQSHDQIEWAAHFVRKSFRRKGRGPKHYVYGGQANRMPQYKADMIDRYWAYQERCYPQRESYFELPRSPDRRPPVFAAQQAWRNVLVDPDASLQEREALLALLPERHRHRWFGSMSSSQAMAQSILGNLAVCGLLWRLAELPSDEGESLLGRLQPARDSFAMEYKLDTLGEPQDTRLDAFLSGAYTVAIECKLSETDVGTCSRARLKPSHPRYSSLGCDGDYARRGSQEARCPLTRRGVLYWSCVPRLFTWRSDRDLSPCPLDGVYQLVRNVLAVGVLADGHVSLKDGHALLLYDARNPAFQAGGLCQVKYERTRAAMLEPSMLRKCSWQRIVEFMRQARLLPWLSEQLALKYGL
ncbi:MAG: hypothetical protein GX557_13845 [Chloroflexi bacterium]|nr:hypothetical protein [Chloroflexota bacterium]